MLHDSLLLTIICLILPQPSKPDESISSCDVLLDRGNANCDTPEPKLRWYYDKDLEECFEYLYEGCGGGRNTFHDESTCRRTRIPSDKQNCGGNDRIIGTCTRADNTCPVGSRCEIGGLGVGICCDIANEEEWQKERNPHCGKGDLLMKTEWYGETPRLGRSCSHKFCPDGYRCIQTRRLAHCCSGRRGDAYEL